ncbi:hypothetical protein H6F42_20175 [Pseudanabaena sp. FACHB-1998]|uniref:hypothetical protein n=1 Tax=Pseudanabaena sp. FACHB-1998 TaxID=2692858 RepID=UPI001681B211|nr:hypothetical protein [Pseudanabaena sp. FACHB-1998]MBD2179244.1 hypothetical protein [Pseudanabaena sp. FACHB-1998]
MKYYRQISTSVFLTLYIMSHALIGYPFQSAKAVLPKKIDPPPGRPSRRIYPPPDPPSSIYQLPDPLRPSPSWNTKSSDSLSLTDLKLKELGTSIFIELSKELSQTYPQPNITALDAATDAFFKENRQKAMDKLLQETTNITARYRCMGFVSLPKAGEQISVLGSQRKDCLSLIVFGSISMSSGIVSGIVYLVQSNK